MKNDSLRNLQLIILDQAKIIYDICKKNDINLYMLGGTFLGAVRHNGFIPWDDDMDFGIKREDYDRFIEVMNKNLNSNYELINCYNTDAVNFHFIKIIDKNHLFCEKKGINLQKKSNTFVDIFILDKIPSNWFIKICYFTRVYFNFYKMRLSRINFIYSNEKNLNSNNSRKNALFKIIQFLKISKMFNYQKSLKGFDKAIGSYNGKNYKKRGNILGGNGIFKEIFDSYLFDDCLEYNFEKTKFLGVKEYDKFLSTIYGDYMKLPSKEEQTAKHIIFDEEKKNEKY